MGPHLAPSPIGPDGGDELGAGNEVEPGSVARTARRWERPSRCQACRSRRSARCPRGCSRGRDATQECGCSSARRRRPSLSRLDAPQGTFEPLTRHAPMKAEADVGVRRGVEDVVALVLRVGHAKAVLRAAGRGMHLQAEVAATHGVEVRRGGTRGAPCQGVPGPPATALHPRTAIPASRTTMVGCWSLDTPRVASSPPIGMRFLLTHRGTFAGLPLTAAIASLPGAGPPSPIARFGGLPHHPPQSRLGIAPFCYNNGNGTRPQGAGREAP